MAVFKPKAKLNPSQVVDRSGRKFGLTEPNRPGFAAYGGANAYEPPLGRPLANKKKDRSGVGGGVLSRKPMTKARKAAINKLNSRG